VIAIEHNQRDSRSLRPDYKKMEDFGGSRSSGLGSQSFDLPFVILDESKNFELFITKIMIFSFY
jgi:hypothetical protein